MWVENHSSGRDWPRRPNPDGRINKNRMAEKKPRWPNRTAEFDETAEYILAIVPTHYFKKKILGLFYGDILSSKEMGLYIV